ncbi:MAG: insulinase family protein, partial [Victivallaceae bacterium]|nr:insulinase family protein [Victivallaceae bacterium]
KKPIRGVSHLAEHIMSYAVRPLEAGYEKSAISSNACTGALHVRFFLQGLESQIRKHAPEFLRRIVDFEPSRELFERERQVVLEEYKDNFTDQAGAYLINLSRKYYDYYGPLGAREDLENLTYEAYLDFQHREFSRPAKLIYVGTTPFEPKKMEFAPTQLKRTFSFRPDRKLIPEHPCAFEEKTVIDFHTSLKAEELAYAKLGMTLLSAGMESPLFKLVREKHALAYFVFGTARLLSGNYGCADILTMVSNANRDKAIELIGKVLAAPEKFLTRKRFREVVASYVLHMRIQEIERYINIDQTLAPNPRQTLDYLMNHQMPTYESMIAFLQKFGVRFVPGTDRELFDEHK